MRSFLLTFKRIFFGLVLALAANGAQAQTVTITAGPGTLLEGTGGPATAFAFTVAKTPGPTGGTTTVSYTLTGTATTPDDYNALLGTINLTNAVPTKNITVLIRKDTKFEPNETLTLTLTGASAGYTVVPPACGGCETATVTNDDVQPSVRVNLASVPENAGFAAATVTLSNKSYLPVTVNAFTADGSAFAPGDYTTTPMPAFVVPADAINATFPVPIIDDFVGELDENFVLQIVSPVNATLGSPSASVGTIFDNDGPALSISDSAQVEGTPSAAAPFVFSVTIPFPAPPGGVGFSYTTGNLTATAGSDYVAQSGTGSIPAGGTQTTISITVTADGVPENHETFEVTLSNPTGFAATIDDGVGLGSIINDDVSALPGQLVISEFRLSGVDCGGECSRPRDEFIEIANTTSLPITVFTTDPSSTGFSVAKSTAGGEFVFEIPNGTVIPARGHFLGANNYVNVDSTYLGYTLKDYGGLNQATPDAVWQDDIDEATGLALFTTTEPANYGASTRLDSVGFTTDVGPNPLYVEGLTGLTPIFYYGESGTFVRKYSIGLSAALLDSGDSAADFVLVAGDAGTYDTTVAVLGGPSPENLASERELTNGQFTMSSPDGAFTFFPGSPKVLEFYRVFTNDGGALNKVRFKVTNLTGVNNTVPGQADLRPTTSLDVNPPDLPDSGITYLGLGLEAFPPNYYVILGADPNGGLNSSLRPSSGVPVPAAGTLPVTFRVEYVNSGPFFYWLVAQGK